jgi:hypothetical protein
MKILIILLTLINSLFANPLSSEGLRIVTPEGWNYSPAQEPLIGIVREPQSAYSAFARNVVFTKEPMTASQIEMFQNDPVSYMKIILMQTYNSMQILEARKQVIANYSGAYIVANIAAAGMQISNLQYYFLHNGYMYSVVYSGLAENFQGSMPIFEKSLYSLNKK